MQLVVIAQNGNECILKVQGYSLLWVVCCLIFDFSQKDFQFIVLGMHEKVHDRIP